MTETKGQVDIGAGETASLIQEYSERIKQALEIESSQIKDKAEKDSREVLAKAKEEAERDSNTIISKAREEADRRSDEIITKGK